MRLPATQRGEPPHDFRQLQRFIENENVHASSAPA
jgi:hypothetical protein